MNDNICLCFAVPTLFAWKIQFFYPNTGGSIISGAIGLPLVIRDCKLFQLFERLTDQSKEKKRGQWYEKWKRWKTKIRKKQFRFKIQREFPVSIITLYYGNK